MAAWLLSRFVAMCIERRELATSCCKTHYNGCMVVAWGLFWGGSRSTKLCSPHLCVGFLVLILYPASASSASSSSSASASFHTQLCHTPSFTTPSFTRNFATHHLSPHHLSPTSLSHTIFRTPLCHPPSFTTPSFTLNWLWWRAWARLVAGDAAVLCVAHAALGDIHLRFEWQACHLVSSTFVLRDRRGRHGTYGTGLALVARLGASDATPLLRGRCGTW